jgi:uncharacterized protein (TIGR02996 family)
MPAASRPEVLALLGDIKSHPEQDGLRLILGDWLEENGDGADQARAELIRCQVEHARLGLEGTGRAAGRRALWLQQQYGPAWLGPVEQWLAQWSCPRGLLSVAVPLESLRSQAMSLVAGTETWAWVEEVFLLGAGDSEVARLRRCVLLEQIAALGLRRCALGPAGAGALGQWPLLGRLDWLDLGQTALGDAGLAVLARSEFLGQLRRLDLDGCRLRGPGLVRLAAAGPARLERLLLWGNPLGDEGARALAGANPFPRLRALDLRGNQIGNAGAASLAGWPGLAGLRELNLADNHLGSGAAFALAESPHLDRVESLVLWGNPINPDGAARLRDRFGPRVHVSTLAFG